MPSYLVPKRSAAHRSACFALYRALLSACSHPSIPGNQRASTCKLVRKSFERNKEVQSPKLLVLALRAGYQARDLLQSCKNGHKESISRLLTLVSDLSSNVKDGQASKATKLQTPQGARRLKSFSIPKPNPNAVSVQSRPHLNITGRRQIPRLVYANQFPFLRFKKPQSPFLSYVIRKKIEQRHKRFDRLHQADEAIEQAAHEDRWDELLSSSYGIGPGQGASEDEPQWTDVARAELRDMSFKLKAQERSNRRIARKMLDIINKEKQLARDEKVRRKVEKSLERKA